MSSIVSLLTKDKELCKCLVVELQRQPDTTSATTPQLKRASSTDAPTLPDHPQVSLQDGSLLNWLRDCLSVQLLDDATRFFCLVSTPDHTHILPLHLQISRNRTVIPVEDPKLHLVWCHGQIFVQPIPCYLLSHSFWVYLEHTDAGLYQTALGFLRSYSCLIKYKRDFDAAQSDRLRLIPKDDGTDPITFERFLAFMSVFENVKDASVSPRYRYGEIRLSRLNGLAPLLFGSLTYHFIESHWMSTMMNFFAPAFTTLLLFTTILTAMQVELAVQSLPNPASEPWNAFNRVCRWFSIFAIILAALVIVFFPAAYIFVLFDQFVHRLKMAAKRRQR